MGYDEQAHNRLDRENRRLQQLELRLHDLELIVNEIQVWLHNHSGDSYGRY